MHVWKLVWVPQNKVDKFYSLWAAEPFRVQYELNKTAKRPPGCGPLVAFKTREQARGEKRCSALVDESKILRCKATLSKDSILWYDTSRCSVCSVSFYPNLPTGTVFCDTITPLEIVR
jgi:hypothetical protein